MYIPIRQTGDYSSVDLVLRTTLPPSELASAVRGSLKSIAPNLPRTDFRTLQQLSGLLFGVAPSDPVTFLGMLIVLSAVAALAGYLPARRASRIDPMVALRAN